MASAADPPRDARIVVVGAGFTGLAAAYELVRRGYRPVVVEAEAELGGLAAGFAVDGVRLERFYHHWFTSDRAVNDLVADLGLADRVVDRPTATGMYFANRMYRLSTPADVLRFTALPPADRIRLGLTVLRARRVGDWRAIEHLGAAEWLTAIGGERAYRVVWEPLLRGKFGRHAEEVSAAWFWAKLILRGGSRGRGGEERLAYFKGGFAALADALAEAIVAGGGEVKRNTAATSLAIAGGRLTGVVAGGSMIPADAAILTPALPIVAGLMRPHVEPAYAARLASVTYLANVCVVLELTRSLTGLYWTNVNDPSFPFVGVIEHTNLDQADPTGRRHVVYFSRYLPADDPMFGWSDDAVAGFTLPHVARMFPAFRTDWVTAAHVWRARYAQPLVVRNYSRLVPGHETPLGGVFIASMAQVYPEDRGTNYAIRDGRKVAAMVARSREQGDGDV